MIVAGEILRSALSSGPRLLSAVFKELFLNGLTLLNLPNITDEPMSMSNLAARQEVRDLVNALNLPGVEVSF